MPKVNTDVDVPTGYEFVHPEEVTEDCLAYEKHRDEDNNLFSIRLSTEQRGGDEWKIARYSIQQHGGYLDRRVVVFPILMYNDHSVVFVREK
jgi:hypothetical protein